MSKRESQAAGGPIKQAERTPERLSARARVLVGLLLSVAFVAPMTASGQPVGGLVGRIVHSVTAEPVAGAVVRVQELGRETRTGPRGQFALDGLVPGDYHLAVSASGYAARLVPIVVPAGSAASIDVAIDPELRYDEVVSVSPGPRKVSESYQATAVLAGRDLAVRLAATLSATLRAQPGLAERSLGPTPGRPVIRGLDGDRVLILEDGQRMGDLSSQSADHAVPLDPAAASRIEIVRGPATLLYGANAIGGLVNIISDRIPTTPVTRTNGSATFGAESAASGVNGAGDVFVGSGHWAVHAIGSGRRTGNMASPEGTIENTSSRSATGSVGLSWTTARGFIGGNYSYDDMRYGIPIIEGGDVRLTPERQALALRLAVGDLRGVFESVRGSFGHRRYRHEEGHANEPGTRKAYDTTELDIKLKQRGVGRLQGSIGASFADRRYRVSGEEALAPPVDERAVSAFVYQELSWPRAALQAGARLDRARYRPGDGARERTFTNLSGSLGVLARLTPQTDAVTVALNLARAVRHPALEELYFFGAHHSIFAFDIGNPDLEAERALGFDASLRWQSARVQGEVTYFRSSMQDYIFRDPVDEEDVVSRFGPIDPVEHGEHDDEQDLPFVQFSAANSLLQGAEGHARITLGAGLVANVGFDYVRGRFQASREPLPRMPPCRLWAGLGYRVDSWHLGAELLAVADQARVFRDETATPGATLSNVFGSYSFGGARAAQMLTVRVQNATNRLYRNHLSFIKDLVPEMGRSVAVTYRIRF